MANPEYVLEMRDIVKVFPGVRALDGVKLQVRPGKVHVICGENGAGKSTLMKIINGTYVADEGEMFYKGYASDFLYASSRKDGAQIGVVFAGRIAYLEHADENITIINANPSEYVAFDSKFSGEYKYTVENCVGEQVSCGEIDIKAGEISTIAAPENGYINMKRV